ncbi:metal/formaldehyde-sensitive transcriptional repressor [Limoniibacter endophyticus]|uniref:DNA-binding FrmR family transcriptional regulator n=1 Tax=Limoniibacter endophyticus TaxID=1565040 RepID=A0A8J3DKP1_9HYPH|nr:metal/formaldehyde-sensitive transcriptional repressor [Limoniibacter endophyticus]GHC77647.1 hypothetical protein GCM10010136_29010 [Limoniibacter endophyticus]
MSHLHADKSKLVARIRRLKGQLDAVERSLEAEADCGDTLQLLASIRGALNGLTTELIETHIRNHVSDPDKDPDEDRAKGARQLISVLKTYMK